MKKYLSVDRDVIKANLETGKRDPVLCVEFEDDSEPVMAYELWWAGQSRLVYRPDACEDRQSAAWIEVRVEVQALTKLGDEWEVLR